MKIDKITFKVGEPAANQTVTIDAPAVVVLVGPNNAGKSLALRELHGVCTGRMRPEERDLIQDIQFDLPKNQQEFETLVKPLLSSTQPQSGHVRFQVPDPVSGYGTVEVDPAAMLSWACQAARVAATHCSATDPCLCPFS